MSERHNTQPQPTHNPNHNTQPPNRPPTKTTTNHNKGFLPEALDAAVRDYLYPSFSPQMGLFLGASSLYGLWKTGKLPGQKQL